MEYNDKLIYDLWLTGIRGIGPAAQHALLDAFGLPSEVYEASEADLIDAGISEKRRKFVLEARDLDEARRGLERCEKHGIFLMTNRDELYPENIRYNPDMPVLLFGKGKRELFDPDADLGIDFDEEWQPFGPDYEPTEHDWWWVDEPRISCPHRKIGIVGARRCSREDKDKCISTVEQLKDNDPSAIIISGGAKGIDGYAHTAAIKNGLRTIAFAGTGPDLCYPKEHTELFEQICEHGMILSEYPPGTKAEPYHFPRRNRLIAGWSDQMYIIGAGRKSGTQSTQRYFEKYHGGRFRSSCAYFWEEESVEFAT